MSYNKAADGPNGVRWKAEIENEYQQMLTNKVFVVVLRKDMPMGTNIINSIWQMKKKSNGTLRG
jgi:hypothetical protein